jgi:hypothetical protein
MKKGTKTWLLWYMVFIHLLAIIGSTGIVLCMSLCYPGVWNWFLLMLLSFVNYIFFDSMFKLIDRIIRRKNRML